MHAGRNRESGFVLLTVCAGAIVLLVMLGLAVDVGRMYIAKTEAQAYSDAAAIAAAMQLDGTSDGITRATAAATGEHDYWNFDTASFSGTTAQFATSANGPWVTNPNPATGYAYVQVQANTQIGLFFMPVVATINQTPVRASAVGGQVLKSRFPEGLFPFSPFAHNSHSPDFGLDSGSQYTLRWASNPKIHSNNVCPGDDQGNVIELAQAQGGSERGFIEDTSSSIIRSTIEDDYQSITRTIGDFVTMTGGSKQTELTSLENRINQDTDTTSMTYADYSSAHRGNGRRIVAVPINDGGNPPGTSGSNIIVQVAAFFLYPTGQYGNGGGQPWCAEYVGPWVQGASHQGASGSAGAFVVRLVQ